MRSSRDKAPYYYVPGTSSLPLTGSAAMLLFGIGASAWVNDQFWGKYVFALGVFLFLANLVQWFGASIRESESGLYGKRIDFSFRWSMSWFIFSEVMFFAAFFGALFYTRTFATEWLGNLDHKVLWPDFNGAWPHFGPSNLIEPFKTMGPFPIPTINTLILLTSGITLTWAHHAMQKNQRAQTIQGLALTVLLGILFLCFQVYEYIHAYTELNLMLTSGIYGALFFMLTGFHGFHVFLGMLMLSVILRRVIRGDFTAQHHFGFEGAAWYWHFVDVVWLLLYLVVYWL